MFLAKFLRQVDFVFKRDKFLHSNEPNYMHPLHKITYNLGAEKGIVPEVPGFTEFLYCLSTAVLFHAAILEPINLRPSYWKFLHANSGGRIACMSRGPLDIWGLNTSESLKRVLAQTKTVPVVYF